MRFYFQHEHTISKAIFACLIMGMVSMMFSCAAVKNPPKGVPYAFNNDVVIRSVGLSAEQRGLLKEKLLEYLDDSLKVNSTQILGKTRRINPPVFDSLNIYRSIRFMNGYLNSLGYYYAVFDSFTVAKDVKANGEDIRVSTAFYVTLGKSIRIDTVVYKFVNPDLQRISDSIQSSTLLKVNEYYSKDKVAAELDRITGVFRKLGYLKISRQALIAEADTVDAWLVDPFSNPAEQVYHAYLRAQNPQISLKIMQRPGVSKDAFLAYKIDSVIIFPEVKVTDDIAELIKDSSLLSFSSDSTLFIKTRDNLFQQKMLLSNNFLYPGQLYNEASYFKTLNKYSQMGPWEQAFGRTTITNDSSAKANMYLFLYPAKKQSFQVDLEGSQNNNISVSNVLAGRFLALALNASHRNRNVFKKGTQSTTTGTVGFELNNTRTSANPDFFQTFIVYLAQGYSIPRLIKPFSFLNRKGIDLGRTNINLSVLYSERFKFFSQTSVNTNLQWEWRKGRNSTSLTLPNFETVFLQQYQDSLDKVIAQNPALKFAFTPGNILSTRAAHEHGLKFKKSNHFGFYRLSGELALKPGFTLFNNEFFTFIRTEAQYVEGIRYRKSSLHYRFYGGIGWDLSGNEQGTLPFFRQFVAGGNNSMRAWGLRQLGLGKSLVSDTTNFPDRFGDIQLEANLEYRFKLFRFFGYPIQGAVFADLGNIWNRHQNIDGEGKFKLKNLYRDLALGIGSGIRWDLSYLVIRLDAGYKVKDPVREGAGWMKKFELEGDNRLGGYERNNIAFQFGIGYPF